MRLKNKSFNAAVEARDKLSLEQKADLDKEAKLEQELKPEWSKGKKPPSGTPEAPQQFRDIGLSKETLKSDRVAEESLNVQKKMLDKLGRPFAPVVLSISI